MWHDGRLPYVWARQIVQFLKWTSAKGNLVYWIELKKVNPSIKAIICSGYSVDERVNKIIEKGALGFIQKPFKINGEIVRVGTDGVGVTFKIESQVQELVLKSFVDIIQT